MYSLDQRSEARWAQTIVYSSESSNVYISCPTTYLPNPGLLHFT
jgi:hypothetical protein